MVMKICHDVGLMDLSCLIPHTPSLFMLRSCLLRREPIILEGSYGRLRKNGKNGQNFHALKMRLYYLHR